MTNLILYLLARNSTPKLPFFLYSLSLQILNLSCVATNVQIEILEQTKKDFQWCCYAFLISINHNYDDFRERKCFMSALFTVY